jgi:phytoene dehydrogenase-like protein
VVGGGHNGLVAAGLLAQAGKSVLVLERREGLGGAVASHQPFPGVEASLSRYSYLVSLLPTALVTELALEMELRPRRVASYSPVGDQGLLVADDQRTQRSMDAVTGNPDAYGSWRALHEMLGRVAQRLFPTLTQPLRSREDIRRLIDDPPTWSALFEKPLSELLERALPSDLLRGIVATDATIGTFAPVDDHQLRQNRCFLYHVIGNGTGRWDVPVGGMGSLARKLAEAARRAGAEIRVGAEVQAVQTDGSIAEVVCSDGQRHRAEHVLAGVAPEILSRLLDEAPDRQPSEGSQLKVNMVVSRLPRLRDPGVTGEEAFAGTLHINEGYKQLSTAYQEAAQGRIPSLPPCEVYCHSLTDPSILSDELRQAGAHTLTLFGLHMPARLFAGQPDARRREALAATLASVNSVLAESIEECLLVDGNGNPCLEVLSPPDLESELAMPGGHIFHRDLSWPFAERQEEVGLWGVETRHPNVWLCGAGARRGGGVSGIPGHNAARAVLAQG